MWDQGGQRKHLQHALCIRLFDEVSCMSAISPGDEETSGTMCPAVESVWNCFRKTHTYLYVYLYIFFCFCFWGGGGLLNSEQRSNIDREDRVPCLKLLDAP